MRCPCGGIILADTEDWKTPRCLKCIPNELLDSQYSIWICMKCGEYPRECLCKVHNWQFLVLQGAGTH